MTTKLLCNSKVCKVDVQQQLELMLCYFIIANLQTHISPDTCSIKAVAEFDGILNLSYCSAASEYHRHAGDYYCI